MFAIIETGGKQYRVAVGQKYTFEKLPEVAGGSVTFDRVLLTADGEDVTVGAPHIAGATVTGKVLMQKRTPKKIVFRFHSKTRYRKKNTHRQDVTDVEITKI
jgi:large subunit ribosomal protein L21